MKPIEVFVRHCVSSANSANKERVEAFSKERCHDNLKETANPQLVNFTYVLDGDLDSHFLKLEPRERVLQIHAKQDARSFLKLLYYFRSLELPDDVIVYFVEDDYLHREGWAEILLEGLDLPGAHYVSLYDHEDKYFLEMYRELRSRIAHTKSCHWRDTPSTTNTYAMTAKTLREDFEIHAQYCDTEKTGITLDHMKFLHLGRMGRKLWTPIPGWSTHMEPAFASPCVDWEALLVDQRDKAIEKDA